MTTFNRRIYIFVPASDQDGANQAAVALTGQQADALTFTVPLTQDGSTTAGYWCCTLADDTALAAIQQTYVPLFPQGRVYACDADTNALTYTNSTMPLGTTVTNEAVLADLGLTTLQPTIV